MYSMMRTVFGRAGLRPAVPSVHFNRPVKDRPYFPC